MAFGHLGPGSVNQWIAALEPDVIRGEPGKES